MPRVALIVTGDLERRGLADALARVFPGAEFHVEMKVDGFTTSRVRSLGATPVPAFVDKVAAALVAAVDPGRTGTPSDFAVAIDDLEIANLDQPEVVVGVFRDAVARHIERVWASEARRERARERVRERASLHLLSPMVEAYFFGDEAPLRAAGVSGPVSLAPGVDLEEFTVTDDAYLGAPSDSATRWARDNRARHPKHYLEYLTADAYRETEHGVRALASTDLGAIAARLPAHLRMLRSLLADLAAALGVPTVDPGPVHPATSSPPTILRNA